MHIMNSAKMLSSLVKPRFAFTRSYLHKGLSVPLIRDRENYYFYRKSFNPFTTINPLGLTLTFVFLEKFWLCLSTLRRGCIIVYNFMVIPFMTLWCLKVNFCYLIVCQIFHQFRLFMLFQFSICILVGQLPSL